MVVTSNFNNVHAQTTQTEANNDQGEIIISYVDQNGNSIRPATTVTGTSGSTYNASIPNIPGYTYSTIENGQNDSYGPQMVFGVPDKITSVMYMTIVYKNSGDTSNNGNNITSNGTVKPKANNNTTTKTRTNLNSKPLNHTDNIKPELSKSASKKNKPTQKTTNSKKVTENNQHPWIISGVIILVIAGIGLIWYKLKNHNHFKH